MGTAHHHHQEVMGPDTIIARTALLPEGRQKFNVGAEIYGKAKMFVALSSRLCLFTVADLVMTTGPGSQRSPKPSRPFPRHRRLPVRLMEYWLVWKMSIAMS